MSLNGFQPDSAVFTAFWRGQEFNSLGQVVNEVYVNFGLVKWFKTLRASQPNIVPQVYFWYNPKEQNDDPDLTLKGPNAASMIADLDKMWLNSGTTTGFQPESAIDTAFWRYQYTNAQNVITNEVYLNMGAIKWVKSLRIPAPQLAGRTDVVSLWFNNKDQDRNPDLVLDDGPSAKLLSDFDNIWAN
jgi:hypothetical protein